MSKTLPDNNAEQSHCQIRNIVSKKFISDQKTDSKQIPS